MQLANLDMIVRRTLLEKGLPIHYYAEVLYHCSSSIRELSKDSLQIVNAANLVVNSYGAVDFPIDFVDDVMCAADAGGLLQEIPKKNNINPIRIHDTDTGQFVPQTNQTPNTANETFYGFVGSWSWFFNFNDFGEPTGRFFGAPGGVSYGYSVIWNRRQIQFTGACAGDNVILLYISNGQSADNASQVDWRAFRAIQTYCDWMRSDNSTNDRSPEARTFYNQRRLLRAELNDLTVTDIKNILRNNYHATIKN